MRLPLILALALAGFLALGVFAERRMAAAAREMDALLRQVQSELHRGRNEPALSLLRRVERLWGKAETTWAMITDHHEMDQVHLAIDRADKLITFDSIPEAQAEIASLRFLIGHIPKKESFGLKSVI